MIGGRVRIQLNRVVAAAGLLIFLPLMAVAERLLRGGGRVVARAGIRVIARACGITFATTAPVPAGAERGQVFVANHSSLLDIPALLMAHPDIRFLAAADLYRNRLLALAMDAIGTERIDRADGRSALRSLRKLADQKSPLCLAVFPEGGIAPPGQRLPFRTGAFYLAIASGATVVPVAIWGTDAVLPAGARFRMRPGTVSVTFLEPIPTAGLSLQDRARLRDTAEAAVAGALAGIGRKDPGAV